MRLCAQTSFPTPRGNWLAALSEPGPVPQQVSWLPDPPTPGPSLAHGIEPSRSGFPGFVPGYSGGDRVGLVPTSLEQHRTNVRGRSTLKRVTTALELSNDPRSGSNALYY